MGGALSSSESGSVTFVPDDIVCTPAVIDRIRKFDSTDEKPVSPTVVNDTSYSDRLKFEKELEKEYDRRLRLVEQRNEGLFVEAAKEYTKTVERLESKYMRSIPGGCCIAAEQRVEDCYRLNSGKTLVCSELVRDYIRCVNGFRLATARKEVASPA